MTYTKNDYTPLEQLIAKYEVDGTFSNNRWQKQSKVSIIVTCYNQEEQLKSQLLALQQQTYNPSSIEVIIADDGSRRGSGSCMDYVAKTKFPFDVKYVWQPDNGFQLAKIRNEALKVAAHHTIISLDADMIPEHTYVENVMKWHYTAQQYGTKIMTTQDRAFVELDQNPDFNQKITQKQLSTVKRSKSRRFDKTEDWRHPRYRETDNMKKIYPSRHYTEPEVVGTTISGGNCSFSRADAFEIGLFDEDFTKYGAEDSEFGLRLYVHFNERKKEQLFFIPVAATAYHLEHGKKVTEKKKEEYNALFWEKVDKFRKSKTPPQPEVSVYIPCYNQIEFIENALESIVNQTFDTKKIEVVIGEDGSTDGTRQLLYQLQQQYNSKLNIKIVDDRRNHGMASNTNRTIQACNGKYIIQLDPDDELLPAAISTLQRGMQNYPNASIVFGDCIDNDIATGTQKPHWSCQEFTPQWYAQNPTVKPTDLVDILHASMRIHSPRMFRRDAFFRTEGVNPNLQNAVDYELYSKLIEVGIPIHIKQPLYIYNINHGANTSRKGRLQLANDRVVKRSTEIRNSPQPRKEIYLVEESKTKRRTKRFDINHPLDRYNALHQIWDTEEQQDTSTKLYSTIIKELQNVVSFFRWVQPTTAQQGLQQLLTLEPQNGTGLYYQATFLEAQGKKQQALQTLKQIQNKSPSTLALETRLEQELRLQQVKRA